MNQLREKLAAIEHEQWMAWSKAVADEVDINRRARWIKLWVPYEQLLEIDKESDRKWADRVIDAFPATSEERDIVPETIGMNSTEIVLLAHDEWKRREERKHNHPEEHWFPGFINGFLTDKKWAREYVKKIKQQAQQPGGGK